MIYHAQLAHTKPYDIRLWRCADFAQHWHSKTEIYVCLKGQMKINIEGTMYCLHQNDAVFVSGNEAHEIFCDVADTQVALIAFGYELLGSSYSSIQNISVDVPFFNLKESRVSPQLLQPLTQICDTLRQLKHEAVTADWIYRSSIYAIAAYLFQYKQDKTISEERMLRAKYLEKMYGTLRFIGNHFREPITVEQAAAVAGYDRSYFCKQFRNATGMTFHRYLNYYRISEACRLLSDSKLPLSVIAERSGFISQKNLSRHFRDVFDMTPTQYRKLPQEAQNNLITHKNILH